MLLGQTGMDTGLTSWTTQLDLHILPQFALRIYHWESLKITLPIQILDMDLESSILMFQEAHPVILLTQLLTHQLQQCMKTI